MIQHKHIERNAAGTDWFVGDIHAERDLLLRTLDRVGFDYDEDRLFSVGDIIDRGPDSLSCIQLLNKPWFHAVQGNHEEMLIRGLNDPVARQLHIKNGGSWINQCSTEELQAFTQAITEHMPLSMTIDNKHGRIGVMHAEAPGDWSTLSDIKDWDQYLWSTAQYQSALTKRSRPIHGIDLVIHGHVNCAYVEISKNQVWIDTLLQSGRLTVLSDTQLFDLII